MSPVRYLRDECCSLIRSWFAVDRIRTAPTVGRLLQLKEGQRVVLCGELAEVRLQTVWHCERGTIVEYLLDYDGSDSTLTVKLSNLNGSVTGLLSSGNRITEVLDADIVVLPFCPS